MLQNHFCTTAITVDVENQVPRFPEAERQALKRSIARTDEKLTACADKLAPADRQMEISHCLSYK
jgi:hypothetical protein